MKASELLLPQTKQEILKKICYGFGIEEERDVFGYTEEQSKFLKFVVDSEYIEMSLVNEAVHRYILEMGNGMYIRHLQTKEFPDHLGAAAVLGYALENKMISPKQITFDHGETADEYILASEGLLEHIVGQLLSFRTPKIPLFQPGELFAKVVDHSAPL
ncbi:MAG: hypothetical protein Q7K40_03470 [bacterium]|nr:hypothetical protein [bacterium]